MRASDRFVPRSRSRRGDTETTTWLQDTKDIREEDREYFASRDPRGFLLVYRVTRDVFTRNPELETVSKEARDKLAEIYSRLNFHDGPLKEAYRFSRQDGLGLLFFNLQEATEGDDKTRLMSEPKGVTDIRSAIPLKRSQLARIEPDLDPDSDRFGKPLHYIIRFRMRSSWDPQGTSIGSPVEVKVHYQRIIPIWTDSKQSVLLPSWDDLVFAKNIDSSLADAIYSNSHPLRLAIPPESFNSLTTAQQDTVRTWWEDHFYMGGTAGRNDFFMPPGFTIEQKGPQHMPDPTPFVGHVNENIGIASGIPAPAMIGAQAGAVEGSEVNIRIYEALVNSEQSNKLEPDVYRVLDGRLMMWRIVPEAVVDYNWPPLYDEPVKAKLDRQLLVAQIARENAAAAQFTINTGLPFEIRDGSPVFMDTEDTEDEPETFKVVINQAAIIRDKMVIDVPFREVQQELTYTLGPLPDYWVGLAPSENRFLEALRSQVSVEITEIIRTLEAFKVGNSKAVNFDPRILTAVQGISFEREIFRQLFRDNMGAAMVLGTTVASDNFDLNPIAADNLTSSQWLERNSLIPAQDYTVRIEGAVKSELIQGINAGESIPQLTDRLRGVMAKEDRHLVTTARSESIKAANASQIMTYQVNGIQMVQFVEFNPKDDACIFRNGQVVPIDQVDIDSIDGDPAKKLLAHPNCRVAVVPV